MKAIKANLISGCRKFPGPPKRAEQAGKDYLLQEVNIMKDRTRQRVNRRRKHYEEKIEKRNAYGNRDLTVFNAVEQIRTHGKAEIRL
jgi:hypothetical protein